MPPSNFDTPLLLQLCTRSRSRGAGGSDPGRRNQGADECEMCSSAFGCASDQQHVHDRYAKDGRCIFQGRPQGGRLLNKVLHRNSGPLCPYRLNFANPILDALICAQSSRIPAMFPVAGRLVSGVCGIARSQLLGESLVSRILNFPHGSPQFLMHQALLCLVVSLQEFCYFFQRHSKQHDFVGVQQV
jgi:hypothetical protein